MRALLTIAITVFLLQACATTSPQQSLYTDLGGNAGIEKIADNFIEEISYNREIFKHFEKTNFERFRAKLIEQLCNVSGGPCEYTGDSMLKVHSKMNIGEGEFNTVVDMMYRAMDRAGVPATTQNRLIAQLAPMRSDIIYR